jgi:tungstate transport system permease protein
VIYRKLCSKAYILQSIGDALQLALQLVLSGDADLVEIVLLSVQVSITASVVALLIGLPIGALVAVARFPGRSAVLVVMNALMGLPPVVVGLLVYLHLSRSGPLGFLGLLYTPTAMIIAQTILITPIVAALSRQLIEDLHAEYAPLFRSLCLTRLQTMRALLWDARYSLITVGLAGFGRAVAEVGAVIIVGGNIDHLTRVMTTAIALETSKGELALALALGMILLVLALLVNGAVQAVRLGAQRQAYV